MSKQEYLLSYEVDKNEWDDFVKRSPQGSVFSETWYLDAMNVKYKILAVYKNERIIAGIVLTKNEINTWSNPMLVKYLGVLLGNEQKNVSQKVLSQQFKILELLIGELKKYKSFDYYFHPNFTNWTPFYWNGFAQHTRYTYRIDLNKEFIEIEKKIHHNIKRNIKNAQKLKVVIKRDIGIDNLLKMVNETFEKQGGNSPYNDKLQIAIKKFFKDGNFVSFGAYDTRGKIISACGLVYDEKSSYLILNGSTMHDQIRGANALMIFEAIKYFKEKGLETFDFEGSMLPGVEQFYRRFGGDLVPYYRIWQDNFFNYFKAKAKKIYKKYKYGR